MHVHVLLKFVKCVNWKFLQRFSYKCPLIDNRYILYAFLENSFLKQFYSTHLKDDY
jgi:hypothetical protein